MYVIGDVHGKTERYFSMVKNLGPTAKSIQLGDMGLGFSGTLLPHMDERHKFFRGNHDSPVACKQHPNYLGDYGYLEEEGIFWVAGAWSIDWKWRTEGKSWWRDEELSVLELNFAQDLYREKKPRLVVTHDCPSEVGQMLVSQGLGLGMSFNPTKTSQALQQMFEIHQPEKWVFGHWHISKEIELRGTKFICLAELEMCEI